MDHSILRYIGGFLLCMVVIAIVSGLFAPGNHVMDNTQAYIVSPTYKAYLNSIWYAFMMIILSGGWGLYILPLLTFHVSAKYMKTYNYGAYIVLSTIVWVLYGLIVSLLINTSGLVLSYLSIGIFYGFYYRNRLFDEATTQ